MRTKSTAPIVSVDEVEPPSSLPTEDVKRRTEPNFEQKLLESVDQPRSSINQSKEGIEVEPVLDLPSTVMETQQEEIEVIRADIEILEYAPLIFAEIRKQDGIPA